jgi:hypothetical protein
MTVEDDCLVVMPRSAEGSDNDSEQKREDAKQFVDVEHLALRRDSG